MKCFNKRIVSIFMATIIVFTSIIASTDKVYARSTDPKWLEFMGACYFADFVYTCENGGTLEYNYDTNTVTLTNANLSYYRMVFGSTRKLNVVLIGDNVVNNTSQHSTIFCKEDLVFSGDGTINVSAEKSYGIWSYDDIYFNNCTVNTSTKYWGVCSSSLYINGANLTVNSLDDYAVDISNSLNMSSGSISASSNEIGVSADVISISDGAINATAPQIAIEANSLNMTGGTLTASGANAIFLYSESSNIVNLSNVYIKTPENGTIYEERTSDNLYYFATVAASSNVTPTLTDIANSGENFATSVEIVPIPEPASPEPASPASPEPETPASPEPEAPAPEAPAPSAPVSPASPASPEQTPAESEASASSDSKLNIKNVLKNFDDEKNTNDNTVNKLKARITKSTNNSLIINWNRISGADGYLIYGCKCGKKNSVNRKLVANISNRKAKSYTIKGLKKGTYYKYIVISYHKKDGKKVYDYASRIVHATTKGGKYGNAKAVKVNKKSLVIKKGKKNTIKASAVRQDKKINTHVALKFISSNRKIAKVNSKGRVTAVGKGKCTIYIFAQNGVYAKVNVRVK